MPVPPVPNTTTFELQDVVDTVNPTTDDLVDCFSDAVSSKFDSAYSGSKNQLLNFRNYGASGVTSYSSSTSGKPSQACNFTLNQTYYHNGSGTYPVVGDNCYSNVAGTAALVPGTYRMATAGISGAKYVVGIAGAISSITNC
jgi:hypothetical protein